MRVELLAPEPLLALTVLLAPAALPIDFWALAADAALVSPDLLPADVVLAIGVLGASLAPAVFFGAADFEEELPLLPVEPADVPELFEAEPPEAEAPDLVDPELLDGPPADFDEAAFVELAVPFDAAVLAEPAELLEEPDELVPFAPPALAVPAADFEDGDFERDPDAFAPPAEPETDSITDAAAPVTAPAAAPASTSPIASLALS